MEPLRVSSSKLYGTPTKNLESKQLNEAFQFYHNTLLMPITAWKMVMQSTLETKQNTDEF